MIIILALIAGIALIVAEAIGISALLINRIGFGVVLILSGLTLRRLLLEAIREVRRLRK